MLVFKLFDIASSVRAVLTVPILSSRANSSCIHLKGKDTRSRNVRGGFEDAKTNLIGHVINV